MVNGDDAEQYCKTFSFGPSPDSLIGSSHFFIMMMLLMVMVNIKVSKLNQSVVDSITCELKKIIWLNPHILDSNEVIGYRSFWPCGFYV